MAFGKEKPNKENNLSSGELKDMEEKMAAALAMRRKLAKEGKLSPEEVYPSAEKARDKGMAYLPEAEFETRLRGLLEHALAMRDSKAAILEKIKDSDPNRALAYKKQIGEIEGQINKMKGILSGMDRAKVGAFLDSVAAEVDERKNLDEER